jgi:DNA gyrase/topoisomerase IV subunit A
LQKRSFKINVTLREAQTVDGVTTFETKFLALSVPELILQWCRMRVQLELRSLAYRIKKQEEAIAYSELLIYAVNKLDLVFKALRTADPDAALVRLLKITPEQAKQILDLQVRKLSKLDHDQLKVKLKEQKVLLKQLQTWQKKPRSKVLLDLEQVKESIVKDRAFQEKQDTQELKVV